MQCRSCGAAVHEGDSFCRTCAMPINMNPDAIIEDVSNPATNDFMAQNNNYTMPQQEPIYYDNQGKKTVIDTAITNKVASDNTKIAKKDGNDRLSATIVNFITFAIIMIIVAIIVYFLYNYVFKSIL
jgi:hypothetical protein